MLVSTELELPVVDPRDGQPAPPGLFSEVWRRLATEGWKPEEFGVVREYPQAVPCINPLQAMVTDTGPTLELVTSPSRTITRLALQLRGLQEEAKEVLDQLGYVMVGMAVHPRLKANPSDYFRFRTPRPSYDYAIDERGWQHWSIINIASVQEVVDVSFGNAVRAVRMLHRLAGLMNFVLRNDPDLHGDYGGLLSVRPSSWAAHVPRVGSFASDAQKVCLPSREFNGWRDYLSLLWEHSSMFLVGTKKKGLAYLPQHPNFVTFLRDAPEGGWPARTLDGEEITIVPRLSHIEQTDWTYMGFARVRWKWHENSATINDFLEAWRSDEIEEFLSASLEKVVVENRCNSTQRPGENLASLALVSGLVENIENALDFALSKSYSFWVSVLEASTTQPLTTQVSGVQITGLARDMVDIAREGLAKRGDEDVDIALSSLYRRIEEKTSPSERLIREFKSGGMAGLLEYTKF